MKKTFFAITAAVMILALSQAQTLFAASGQESYFYYLIPPKATLTINDKEVKNTSTEEGKMRFRKADAEQVEISKDVRGVTIGTKQYEVDIRDEVSIELSDQLHLEAGSIHVMTFQGVSGASQITLGDLVLSFQSADFLAYISRDQSEKVIKVLEGEVSIDNPDLGQETILKSQQATSINQDGKLLAPSDFVLEDIQDWWNGEQFEYEYQSLPIAHAGEDQRVLGSVAVVLDGSLSDYKTGDIFEWTLIKGPKDDTDQEITQVAFDSINIVKPLFTPVIEGEYHFTLQITNQDGEKSNVDHVTIFVGKRFLRPIAIFPDVPADHPNNLAITFLYKKNVMKGSEDPDSGKVLFRPEDTINRVEILKTLFENRQLTVPSEEELRSLDEEIFKDVKADQWFAPYVYLAKEMEIVKGSDGFYRPADEVILVEAIKIIAETYQINIDEYGQMSQKPYPDAEEGAWYNPYLFFVKKYNLINTDPVGNISPAQPMTRANFAEVIYRMESINLVEKRGYLSGVLTDTKRQEGVPDAEIYIYTAIRDEDGEDGFLTKGDLIHKTTTRKDGGFTVSLPIHSKYYVEAISGDIISSNRVITELKEDETVSVALEISLENE